MDWKGSLELVGWSQRFVPLRVSGGLRVEQRGALGGGAAVTSGPVSCMVLLIAAQGTATACRSQATHGLLTGIAGNSVCYVPVLAPACTSSAPGACTIFVDPPGMQEVFIKGHILNLGALLPGVDSRLPSWVPRPSVYVWATVNHKGKVNWDWDYAV